MNSAADKITYCVKLPHSFHSRECCLSVRWWYGTRVTPEASLDEKYNTLKNIKCRSRPKPQVRSTLIIVTLMEANPLKIVKNRKTPHFTVFPVGKYYYCWFATEAQYCHEYVEFCLCIAEFLAAGCRCCGITVEPLLYTSPHPHPHPRPLTSRTLLLITYQSFPLFLLFFFLSRFLCQPTASLIHQRFFKSFPTCPMRNNDILYIYIFARILLDQ